jgi:hypothetical protein
MTRSKPLPSRSDRRQSASADALQNPSSWPPGVQTVSPSAGAHAGSRDEDVLPAAGIPR